MIKVNDPFVRVFNTNQFYNMLSAITIRPRIYIIYTYYIYVYQRVHNCAAGATKLHDEQNNFTAGCMVVHAGSVILSVPFPFLCTIILYPLG